MEYMLYWFLVPVLNYGVTKCELLTVFLELKRWYYYLLDKPFVVHSDHASLQWFLSQL